MLDTSKGSEDESYPCCGWCRISASRRRLRITGQRPTCAPIRSNSTLQRHEPDPAQHGDGPDADATVPRDDANPTLWHGEPDPAGQREHSTSGPTATGLVCQQLQGREDGWAEADCILSETQRYLAHLRAQNQPVHRRHLGRQRESYLRRGNPARHVNAVGQSDIAARLLAFSTDPKTPSSDRGFWVAGASWQSIALHSFDATDDTADQIAAIERH